MECNERGISLVELLATLTLVSLVTVTIWTVFAISSAHNISETKKLRLQQEMNYIITEIQRLHRKCDKYDFVIEENRIAVENCAITDRETGVNEITDFMISTSHLYSYKELVEVDGELVPKEVKIIENPLNKTIIPKQENLIVEEIIIQDPKNTKLKISVPLSVSRYKQSP